MRRLGRWLVRIGAVLVVLVIILALAAIWFIRRPWPQVSGTLQVKGLSAPVQVIRDQWGVPQIYAQNDHDLIFAQGYVHAQDRLWQMELDRRASSGTLSEALGKSTVDTDHILRALGLRRIAERTWPTLDADSRAILQAYADGVNAYIDTHRDNLPVEFTLLGINPQPWTPIDTLAWGNLVAFNETVQGWEEIEYGQLVAKVGEKAAQELIPPYEQNTPTILPAGSSSPAAQSNNHAFASPASGENYQWLEHSNLPHALASLNEWLGDPQATWGSNSWVVSGKLTATGKPLLANDTHIDLRMPSLWYENGLHGGRFNTVGYSFPGAPLVVIGHNDHIAWGLTNLRADDMDNYIEKLNDLNNPTQYQLNGEWHNLEFVTETIKVKGQAPVSLEIPMTPDGPIINADTYKQISDSQALALRWTVSDGNHTIQSILALDVATSWDQFRAALQSWDAPAQSFVYADTAGNIGYQAAGKIPIRVPGDDGRLPMPGWTGTNTWQGFIPFDQLPTTFNPSSGFIVTANNKAIPDSYPYLISSVWNPGYRASRINELLSTNSRLTVADMQHIQADTYSLPARELVPYLLAIKPQNELEAQAMTYLKAWDLQHATDSVGASLYETWYLFMIKNTVSGRLGTDSPPGELHLCSRPTWLIQSMAAPNNTWFPDVKTRDDLVSRSLADAVNWLSQHYGQNPASWQWGKLHTMTFVHTPFGQSGIPLLTQLFNSRTVPVQGDNTAVDLGEYDCYRRPFQVYFGSSQRMIADLSNWDSLLSVNSTGQSGQLMNPNRDDQISLWANVQYRTLPFSRPVVDKSATATLTLTP